MKTLLLSLLASLSIASAATYQYSNTWSVAVTQSIVGTTVNGTATHGSTSVLSLPYFNASEHNNETLVGVSIEYSSPLTTNSITSTITCDVGSSTFSSVTTRVNTLLYSSDLSDLLEERTHTFDYGMFTAVAGNTWKNLTINKNKSAAMTYTREYDDVQYSTSDETEASLFQRSGTFVIDVDSDAYAKFVRSNTSNIITFNYNGVDSGCVTVTYITIPEPSVALGLMGITLLILRRRK